MPNYNEDRMKENKSLPFSSFKPFIEKQFQETRNGLSIEEIGKRCKNTSLFAKKFQNNPMGYEKTILKTLETLEMEGKIKKQSDGLYYSTI